MASMEQLDGTLSMENLVLVSEAVEPYVLSLADGTEEGAFMEVTALAVMRRAGGILLAVPVGYLDEDMIEDGNSGRGELAFGPSFVAEVPGVILDNGQIAPSGSKVAVLVIDCLPEVLHVMREFLAEEEIVYGFDHDSPYCLPSPDALLVEATKWISGSDQTRVGYYTPEEAEAPQVFSARAKVSPSSKKKPRGGLPISSGEPAKPKKATTASIAAELAQLKDVIPSLTAQMSALQEKVSKSSAPPGPMTSRPLSSMLQTPMDLPSLGEVAKQFGTPPRVAKQAPGMLGSPFFQPPALKELESEKQEVVAASSLISGDALAQAVLAQSQALTSLVSQISQSSTDPMLDLSTSGGSGTRGAAGRAKLQSELAGHKAIFFQAVLQQMARRMSPTASSDIPPQMMLDRGISGQRYLERFGGYSRQRELGQLQWQIMGILDFMMAENYAAAKDGIALLAVSVEQAAMDSGRMDLASVLCLQEDPPAGVFMNRQLNLTSRAKAFSPLADQRWITVALAYLKEMDVITAKRQEMLGVQKPGGGTTDPDKVVKPKGAPKKRGKGAGRSNPGQAEEEEG